jgi:hypothetical protein
VPGIDSTTSRVGFCAGAARGIHEGVEHPVELGAGRLEAKLLVEVELDRQLAPEAATARDEERHPRGQQRVGDRVPEPGARRVRRRRHDVHDAGARRGA